MDYSIFYLPSKDRIALCEHIGQTLLCKPEIVYAYAHGSFVTEEYFRDIDIAVWIDDQFRPEQSFAYEDEVAQEIVGKNHNRLVHMYWDVDYSQVYEILSHNLTDLDAFSREVISWL